MGRRSKKRRTRYWFGVSSLPFGFELGSIDVTKRSPELVEHTARGEPVSRGCSIERTDSVVTVCERNHARMQARLRARWIRRRGVRKLEAIGDPGGGR